MKKEKTRGPEKIHAQLWFFSVSFFLALVIYSLTGPQSLPCVKQETPLSLMIGCVNWEIHPCGFQDPLFLK